MTKTDTLPSLDTIAEKILTTITQILARGVDSPRRDDRGYERRPHMMMMDRHPMEMMIRATQQSASLPVETLNTLLDNPKNKAIVTLFEGRTLAGEIRNATSRHTINSMLSNAGYSSDSAAKNKAIDDVLDIVRQSWPLDDILALAQFTPATFSTKEFTYHYDGIAQLMAGLQDIQGLRINVPLESLRILNMSVAIPEDMFVIADALVSRQPDIIQALPRVEQDVLKARLCALLDDTKADPTWLYKLLENMLDVKVLLPGMKPEELANKLGNLFSVRIYEEKDALVNALDARLGVKREKPKAEIRYPRADELIEHLSTLSEDERKAYLRKLLSTFI